ncbi:MAG: hypothetical protein CR991_11900 [Proteobacteria bacterium]|nr:MAG: hypothetical protein CR991_11900 [Pseudomonadota bacterium]
MLTMFSKFCFKQYKLSKLLLFLWFLCFLYLFFTNGLLAQNSEQNTTATSDSIASTTENSLLPSSLALTSTAVPGEAAQTHSKKLLDDAESILNKPDLSRSDLDESAAKALQGGQAASSCIDDATTEQQRLSHALATLEGKSDKTPETSPTDQSTETAPSDKTEASSKNASTDSNIETLGTDTAQTPTIQEDEDVNKAKETLNSQLQTIESRLSNCRLLKLRADEIQNKISKIKQLDLERHLYSKNKSAWAYLKQALRAPTLWATESHHILSTLTTLPIHVENLNKALLYGVLAMLFGLFWSLRKKAQYNKGKTHPLALSSPTLDALWRNLITTIPFILLLGVIWINAYFQPFGVEALVDLIATLFVFTVSYSIVSAMLRTNADPAEAGLLAISARSSSKLYFWAKLFLFTTLLSALFYSSLFDTEPESSLVGLIRIAIGTLSGLALIRLLWLLRRHFRWLTQYRLYIPAALTILVSIAALWLGYRNFFSFLFAGTFGTLFILLIGWMLLRIPAEIFDGLDEGQATWQKRARKRLGLADHQMVPGLIWLRLLAILLVFAGIAVMLMRTWGVSWQEIYRMFTEVKNGIEIGDFTFEPLRILSGLLVISLLIGLTHLAKNNMANAWLRHTNLSRGAKEASVTVAGYIGVTAAILIGLSVAGIQFSQLALIASALSIGIGFGLQNIVSNFISGLILLFERPIRRGDWIKVGNSEGYVRDISIRSTVIQTFNRADIIVPNSELISGQVTNMMLHNQYGRVIIPIRVAYGSDPEQVMQLLHSIAEKHPVVLREQGELKVQVLFLSFGDSALHFELRCLIRDVEKKMIVTSDLNLAIDKAFREAGIEIPFPQRTLHIVKDAETAICNQLNPSAFT